MTTIDHLNPPTGQMANNVVGFARALRAAGIPVGPGTVIDALNALQVIEIGNRADVYATLEAIFVKRHEHALIFAQAFELFFRAAEEWKSMLDSVPLPDHARKKPPPASRRVQEAMAQPSMREEAPQAQEQELKLSVSDKEVLQKKDFAQMTAAEIAAAKDAIARLRLPLDMVRTRRLTQDRHGHLIDIRRTLRASMKAGGAVIDLKYLGPRVKEPPIVALLDISGSMSEYTRLFLHFLHAVTDARKRVTTFLFGTRLTNVTRAIRQRDPDEALAACSANVADWSGGTRIASSLHIFNTQWARRVLGQGAVVLLITDGLERDADDTLAFEIDRLHRSCRRLIWLNPLLRFHAFEARAKGVQTMLPHVDELRPIHNLDSMKELVRALSGAPAKGYNPKDLLKQVA